MSGRRRRAGDPMLLRRVKIYTDQSKLNIKGSKGREEVSGDLRLWALRRKICRLIYMYIRPEIDWLCADWSSIY